MSLELTLRPKQDISDVYQKLQQVNGVHFIDIR
jgi:putative Mg2+ transporter-C (MgtC) family protein